MKNTNENKQMVLSQTKEIKHHADELSKVLGKHKNIESWVVGKIERASTDLSDVTHYLDGKKYAKGGEVESEINELYKKSKFINDDFNWKLKLLEMLQDNSIDAYNIYQTLTKQQKEDVLQEQFELDNDMGSDGDGDIETTKENLNILLQDAKNGKKYAKGGKLGGLDAKKIVSKEDGKYYVIDAKSGNIVSKGFDTEEEAKVEMYKIFEETGNFFLTQKKMAKGGDLDNWKEALTHEEFVSLAKSKGYKDLESASNSLGYRYNGEKWIDKRNNPYKKPKHAKGGELGGFCYSIGGL